MGLSISVIQLVRVLFMMASREGVTFFCSMESFLRQAPRIIVEFDASLTWIGLIWYRRERDGSESPIAYRVVDVRCMEFNCLDYQNLAEFIGAIFAVRGLGPGYLNLLHEPIALRWDSVAALTWAEKDGVTLELASAASVVYAF
jgi:hypothetical protein